ncbi:MAG: calcium-binding protein [Aliishimia sp.]
MSFYSSLVLLVDVNANEWSLEQLRVWDEDRYFGDGFRSVSPAQGSLSLPNGLEVVDFGAGSGQTIVYEFQLNNGLTGTNFAPGLRLSDGKYVILPQGDGTFAGRNPTDFEGVAFVSATTYGGPGTLPATTEYSRYGFSESPNIDVPEIGGVLLELFRSQSQFQGRGGGTSSETGAQVFLYEGRSYQFGLDDANGTSNDLLSSLSLTDQEGQSGQLIANVAGASFSPNSSGYYYLEATHQGDVSVQIRNDDHGDVRDDATATGVGRTITGEFNGPSDVDFFSVFLAANQNVKIDVENFVETQRGVSLAMFDEEGRQLALRSGTDGATLVFSADQSGTYFIRTQGWSDFSQDAPTRYSVSVSPQAEEQVPATATSLGEDNRYYQDWTPNVYQNTVDSITINTDVSPRSVHALNDNLTNVTFETGDMNTASQTVLTGGMQAVLPGELTKLYASGTTPSLLFQGATTIGINSGIPDVVQSSTLIKSAEVFQQEGLFAGFQYWANDIVQGAVDWWNGTSDAFGSPASLQAFEPFASTDPTFTETPIEFRGERYDLVFNFGGHNLVVQDQFSGLHSTKPNVAVDQIEFESGDILHIRTPGLQGNGDDELLISIDPGAVIAGGGGNDVMIGVNLAVNFHGDSGADILRGSGQADILRGGSDNDVLLGDASNDLLFGDAGDDILVGGAGDDALDGGEGNDTASYAESSSRVVVRLNLTADVGGDQGMDSFISIENVIGSAFDDRIVGDAFENVLTGGQGRDVLIGLGGDDTLNGEAGDDELIGSGGNDVLNGGDGDDTLSGLGGADTLNGQNGNDQINGGQGVDDINGGDGSDSIFGLFGADRINGGVGNDNIRADGSGDTVIGGAGDDRIVGGNGKDTIWGGSGNDVFFGGGGHGNGDGLRDVFVFKSAENDGGGFDIIRDFEDNKDKLDLSESVYDNFDDLLADTQQVGSNVEINFDGSGILRIEDFQMSDFNAGDVLF